jgi:hypothetical protein
MRRREPGGRAGGQTVMDKDKKHYRKLKRQVKKAGNKSRRAHLKRDLADNPEEAHLSEYDFGNQSSATMNGMDDDATRRRGRDEEE